ncbi:MAG TPA: cysteine desulfurase, partial [Thauera aminoaromatica]|nr:cysteine desulfurase [Thauera aminoaromatica]
MNFAPIYLDWNATTPLDPAVREAMLPWLGAAEPARFGNASSRHEYGRQARAAV